MELKIKGRNAIVCASSKGLGRGCAKALAREGVNVVINGRNEDEVAKTAAEIRAESQVLVTEVVADVTTSEGRAKLLQACSEPDILINNAAFVGTSELQGWGVPFEEQTASIFAGTNGYLDGIPVTDVTRYEESMLADLRANHAGILKTIRDSRDFSDDSKKALMAALDTFTKNFA